MNQLKSKPSPNPLSTQETASYLADMSLQMLKLAKGQGYRALEQIFELAYYEAFSKANPIKITDEELEELKALNFRFSGKKAQP